MSKRDDQLLSRIEKKLDNLEGLLRMLLVQNVAQEISTAIDKSLDEIPDSDTLNMFDNSDIY